RPDLLAVVLARPGGRRRAEAVDLRPADVVVRVRVRQSLEFLEGVIERRPLLVAEVAHMLAHAVLREQVQGEETDNEYRERPDSSHRILLSLQGESPGSAFPTWA